MAKKNTAQQPREKKECPISREDFLDSGSASFSIPVVADPREFQTGSFGYYHSGKISVNGVPCQVSCNIVVIGSKDA